MLQNDQPCKMTKTVKLPMLQNDRSCKMTNAANDQCCKMTNAAKMTKAAI